MATHLAARRNPVLFALLTGFLLLAGHTAYADDDDWHTEADRPLAPAQQMKDREKIQAIAAEKPQREQVYAPRSTFQATPVERYIESVYQTATVDRQH
jgi:hypothetical protein